MKSNIWKYYLFSFLSSFVFFSGVLIPFFTKWGGINQFQIQLLQAWFMFWIFVLEVPTGAIADYFGRKYSIALGALMFAIGTVVYGSTHSFYVFMIGEFLIAMAVALQSGADEALMYDSLKQDGREDQAKTIAGRARSIELLAMGLSAPIGSFIAFKTGLNVPMLLTGASMVIATIVAMTFREPKVKNSISESKRYLTIVKSGWSYIKAHTGLKKIALDGVLVSASAYFVIWTYQRLLQNLNVSIAWFGVFHLILTLVQIFSNNTFRIMEVWAGSVEKYLRITAVLVGLGFVAVAINLNMVTLGLFILLSGGFGLTRMTHLSAHLNKLIMSENRATVLSFLSMFRRFFLVFLNPVVGFFIDKSLSFTLLGLGMVPIMVGLFSPIKESMLTSKKG